MDNVWILWDGNPISFCDGKSGLHPQVVGIYSSENAAYAYAERRATYAIKTNRQQGAVTVDAKEYHVRKYRVDDGGPPV